MLKKLALLILALCFSVCSNLHRSCDVELRGQLIAEGCSPEAVRHAERTARLTAEEILTGNAELPELTRHIRYSFFTPSGSCPELSDALLRATPGIAVSSLVCVGSTPMGSVADGEAFIGELRRHILNTMPTWAVCGSLSQELSTVPQYCRAGAELTDDDMIQLVTGRAPVLFSDGKEHISTV